ncbi:CHAT domain-containing protein [Allocoleopsis sp.]|uniref:CHAT domain-containing protein n=1 Tax=Allocoleopsis sp. TaxID=3088169 RepID=UPI002FD4D8D4
MRARRSLPQFALTILLATPVALSLVLIVNFPLTAVAQAQTREDRKAEGDRLLRQGIEEYHDYGHETALQSLQQALSIYQAIQDRNGEATVLMHLGIAYEPDEEAISYYEKALSIFKEVNNRNGEMTVLMHLGELYFSFKKYEEAITYYEKALPIAQQLNSRNHQETVLAGLISAYMFLSQNEKAAPYIEAFNLISQQPEDRPISDQSTEVDSKLRQRNAEGDALRASETKRLLERGIQQYRSQDALDGGGKSWERALNIYREIQDLKGESQLLMDIGNACRSLPKCRNATYYYEKAIPIYQQLKDLKGEAKALSRLGELYLPKDEQPEKAIALYQKALTIYQQLKDKSGEAKVLLNLGIAHNSLSKHEQAISYYKQALPIVQTLKDPKSEVELLFNLGLAYDLQSKYQEAIRYYQQAIPIFPKIPASLNDGDVEGAVMRNLAFIHDSLSQYAESIEYYKKALSIYRKYKNRQGEGRILFNLAKTYSILSQYDEAAYYYEQALPIYREYNAGIGEIIFNLGNSYMAMSEYQKAISYYEDLLSFFETSPNIIPFAQSYGGLLIQLSKAYSALSQHEKASSYYKRALSALNITGRDENIELFSELGLFFQQQNQPELAITIYKKSVNSHETFRRRLFNAGQDNLPFPMALSEEQSRSVRESYTKNIAGTYRALADLLLQQNRVVEALQVLDLLKEVDLQDFIKDTSSTKRFNESIELLPEEEKILHTFEVLITNNFEPYEWFWKDFTVDANGDTFTAAGQQLERKEVADAKERQALQRKLIKDFPEDSAIKPAIQTLKRTAADQNLNLNAYQDLQSSIKKLGKNIALFYPLILDDRLELVILTNDRAPIHKSIPIPQKQLESEIQTFRQQLQGRDPRIKQPAQKLYQSIIQPIEAELKAAGVDTIVYAPDGIMRYVPLAALYDGTQWLAERYQINYLTALALTPLDKPTNLTPKVLAGAVTKAYSPIVNGQKYNFAALSQTQTEVEQIAKLYPDTRLLINDSLSRSALKSNVSNSTIIHLATHASFVSSSPDKSFILLGDGSTLSLRDLNTLTLPNVSLFILSACETAMGSKLSNGIEIFGFGYQLQRNQVRASLASLWQVNDGGTQVLMNRFYDELKQGKTVAKAMQQVQQAFINHQLGLTKDTPARAEIEVSGTSTGARSVDFSHPYYWAPFILIGNGL